MMLYDLQLTWPTACKAEPHASARLGVGPGTRQRWPAPVAKNFRMCLLIIVCHFDLNFSVQSPKRLLPKPINLSTPLHATLHTLSKLHITLYFSKHRRPCWKAGPTRTMSGVYEFSNVIAQDILKIMCRFRRFIGWNLLDLGYISTDFYRIVLEGFAVKVDSCFYSFDYLDSIN